MSATIFNRYTGIRKSVKNLGWLLKHASEVKMFAVDLTEDGGADLTAYLENHNYYTHFASKEVCWMFLHRPVFVWRDLNWNGKGSQSIFLCNKNSIPKV